MTVKAVQWKIGVLQDGDWGPASKTAFQRYLHVPANGNVDAVTIKALQRHVGASQNGKWTPWTTKCLQRALNTGHF
jgi:hypothetical protein